MPVRRGGPIGASAASAAFLCAACRIPSYRRSWCRCGGGEPGSSADVARWSGWDWLRSPRRIGRKLEVKVWRHGHKTLIRTRFYFSRPFFFGEHLSLNAALNGTLPVHPQPRASECTADAKLKPASVLCQNFFRQKARSTSALQAERRFCLRVPEICFHGASAFASKARQAPEGRAGAPRRTKARASGGPVIGPFPRALLVARSVSYTLTRRVAIRRGAAGLAGPWHWQKPRWPACQIGGPARTCRRTCRWPLRPARSRRNGEDWPSQHTVAFNLLSTRPQSPPV